MAETKRDRERRRELLVRAAAHVLRGEGTGADEMLVCSCGWSTPSPCWHNDAVLADIGDRGHHCYPCVLIVSPGHGMQSLHGIVIINGHYKWKLNPGRDLEWLASSDADPSIPDVLREAAQRELSA